MRFPRALRRRLGLSTRRKRSQKAPWSWLDIQSAVAAPRPSRSPVFVGGTGRSGTTIIARLIGTHPTRQLIRIETRFLVDPGGLCHLVEGRSNFVRFEQRVLEDWFQRSPTQGLFTMIDRPALEEALQDLRANLRIDRHLAARVFVHRIFDPIAADAGALGWVEMTPDNALAVGTLLRIFPDMRFIHSLRDGRDVACSVVRVPWGPNDLDDALDWWARKLERAFTASDLLPSDRVHTIQLEDLVTRDRERQYRGLRDFLGLDDDPAMRRFFDESVTPDRGHFGRWREEVPPERRASFEAHHHALATQLAEDGRAYRPHDVTADSAA